MEIDDNSIQAKVAEVPDRWPPAVTFVLSDSTHTVYFAGDTLLIPELAQLPQRFGHVGIALLPTNGLQIRPQANKQVVMNALQAAELTAILGPQLAVPHHYAFTSGWLGDRLLTKSDANPEHYAQAARELAPTTEVRIAGPAPGWPCNSGGEREGASTDDR